MVHLATFLVPMQAKGIPYSPLTALDRLKAGLLDAFGGWTCLGDTYGAWRESSDNGASVVYDVCKRFQMGMDTVKFLGLNEKQARQLRKYGRCEVSA